jgi:hypothetical protein
MDDIHKAVEKWMRQERRFIKNLPRINRIKRKKDICPICLDEMVCCDNIYRYITRAAYKKMVVKLNGCSHSFHIRCIKEWLVVTKTCPLCRYPVEGENGMEISAI